MSWDLVLRHCASIRATLDLTRVNLDLQSAQLAALEAYAKALAAPKAEIEAPATCRANDPEDCARMTADAVLTFGGMSGNRQGCRGCGQELTITT